MCVYPNSRNDVPRVAQRYGTIAAHTRRLASVFIVCVVFCVNMYRIAGVTVYLAPLDSLPPGGQAVPGYLAPHPGYLHPRGGGGGGVVRYPSWFILPPLKHNYGNTVCKFYIVFFVSQLIWAVTNSSSLCQNQDSGETTLY